MFKRFLKNRRGTAEIIGSALFIVIMLFFFSNVYLWHDQATREMNNVLLERMNASVSMAATDEGVNVTNNGGVTFALSRLWILDDNVSNVSQHYYADLENIPGHRISVDAGQTINISLNSAAPPVTGSPIDVSWINDRSIIVQYAPPDYPITLRILTEFGNTASCSIDRSIVVRRPNITLSTTRGPVGTPVTLSGSNFEPTSQITVKYDGSTVLQNQTDDLGAFLYSFPINRSEFGNHVLTVTDDGGSSANATFAVTPSLTVASVPNGYEVTLNGFAANSNVTIAWLGPSIGFFTGRYTNSLGYFTTSGIRPAIAGDYWVTATDANSDSASGVFRFE